jgi:hypothetical protein
MLDSAFAYSFSSRPAELQLSAPEPSGTQQKQGNQSQKDAVDEVCRRVNLIKQRSGHYNRRSKSFPNHYPKIVAPLVMEMLAFLGMELASYGLRPGEVCA